MTYEMFFDAVKALLWETLDDLPEYKLLEYRLIVNKELYDEKVIDFKTFNEMENSLIGRLTKIRNEYLLKEVGDN